MGITGVGSSYNFVYNTKTGKLSTKDGSKNEFVDFCNGDVKGEDTETLNHFDAHTRYQFQRMLYVYGTGMTGQNPFENDEKVEITADIDSATHTSFYVNGQKAFTAITGMSYLPYEIRTFGTVRSKESESCRQADCTGRRRNIKFHYFNIGRLWCSNSESGCQCIVKYRCRLGIRNDSGRTYKKR